MRLPWTICLCINVGLFTGASAHSQVAPAQFVRPLRYAFQPGDYLVYERRAECSALATGNVRRRTVDRIQLWCLSREGRETLILLDLTRTTNGQAEPARGALVYLDHRGRRRLPDVIQTRVADLDPAFELIPELRPTLQSDLDWTTGADLYGRRWRCKRIGPDSRYAHHVRVDFSMEDPTGASEVLGQSRTGSFWFDPNGGAVMRVESNWGDRHAGVQTHAITVLRMRQRHDQRWCSRRSEEAQRFLRTLRHEDRFLQQIINEPTGFEQTFKRLTRLWVEFLVDLRSDNLSPFHRLGAARPHHLVAQRERLRARAWLGQQWLGQAAADWSLQTPDGQTITSEQFRDGYVVECFWSADSRSSLRAFEMLRRLKRDMSGRPLRVVCLSLDRDVEAARRAAQRCDSGLDVALLGQPIAGTTPPELPVFRVLDERGRIRAVFVGWRPSLADKLTPLLQK